MQSNEYHEDNQLHCRKHPNRLNSKKNAKLSKIVSKLVHFMYDLERPEPIILFLPGIKDIRTIFPETIKQSATSGPRLNIKTVLMGITMLKIRR